MPFLSLRRLFSLIVAVGAIVGCHPAPSRAEALEALREAASGTDTTTAIARVWQDGPPWFSCAEVLSKLGGRADTAIVRDQVGNWRPLVLAGWLVLRDTARGPVTDPGWCVARPTEEVARHAQGWHSFDGDSFPTGAARRGWKVPIGRRKLVVAATPKAAGRDSATVEFTSTVAVNANGAAMRADRDSVHWAALLYRMDGRWRVASMARRVPSRAAKPRVR